MKTFTKLFMAVVAGVLAFSCVTDTTEDLGVNLGEGQSTTLTLSLEDSRTYIGEYDGVQYPMYWSVGDKITVNGHTSLALTAEDINGNSATFTIPAILEGDYCVTYPAAPAGQVKFAAEQTHKDDTTFGDGVATLYGYGSPEEIELKNLTGILKIGITGSATLKYAQISTVDRTPIAGEFNLDFTKGVVTPTATAKSVINYSFGDGVTLKGDATYIHVAVPAGIYDELYVTLYDTDGGVMYATVKAYKNDETDKSLKAGKVREFKKDGVEQFIEYTPADVYVVSDAGTLAGVKNNLDKKVVMVADVDMTGKDWSSIEDFAGSFYGNGYAIKGLTAPLFGTTTGTIKGVHLVDVEIQATNPTHLGAVACHLLASDNAHISHCSASGTMVATFTDALTDNVRVGGIIADTTITGDITDLVSDVDITFTGTRKGISALGGIVSVAETANIYNCTNLGTITCTADTSNDIFISGITHKSLSMVNCINGSKNDTTGDTGKIVFESEEHGGAIGVAGLLMYPNADIINSHNYGNIYYKSKKAARRLLANGLAYVSQDGVNMCYRTNCSNHGDIVVSGSSDTEFVIGGFEARHMQPVTFDNCHNHGDITVESTADTPTITIGGMVGMVDDNGEHATIVSCSNKGDITVSTAYASKVYLGGIAGKIAAGSVLMQYSDNTKPSSNSGDIKYSATNPEAYVYIGGAIGFDTALAETTSSCRVAFFTNEGDITVEGECLTANIGGMVGRVSQDKNATRLNYSLISIENKAPLTVSATVNGDCAIGGINGFLLKSYASSASGNWVNRGKLSFTGKMKEGGTDKNHRLLVGGYIGASDQPFSGTVSTVYNFGDIECTGTIDTTKGNRVGGIFGQMNRTFANCHCYCTITALGYANVGMLTGSARAAGSVVASNCTVGGKIATSTTGEGEAERPNEIELSAGNYFNYIYGSADWTGVEDYDGCTFEAMPTPVE